MQLLGCQAKRQLATDKDECETVSRSGVGSPQALRAPGKHLLLLLDPARWRLHRAISERVVVSVLCGWRLRPQVRHWGPSQILQASMLRGNVLKTLSPAAKQDSSEAYPTTGSRMTGCELGFQKLAHTGV